MMMWLLRAWLACLLALMAAKAIAEVKVAATIAPVHSLVSMVTAGESKPALIVEPGASPHSYAMKPSEARSLDEADVVFWVGPSLEPWMTKALSTLAANARVVELGNADKLTRLGMRDGGIWAGHAHHEQSHGELDHHEDDQTLSELDPHLWLDPDNAIAWVQVIAGELSLADPERAAIYRANAERAADRLTDMASAMERDLWAVRATPYIVFHDAYQYLEHRFDLNGVGAVSFGDASRPGAARLIEMRQRIQSSGAVCAFAEPQFDPKLLETVIEGSAVKKAVLDPIGADLEPGVEFYPSLMKRLAASLIDCLS